MRKYSVCLAVFLGFMLVPATVFAYGEKIAVSPTSGPAGQLVTVTGTGWQDHARRGWDIPIRIGILDVARGHPDANGEFSVNFNIPLSSPVGQLTISAITGDGDGRQAYYTVSDTPPPGCFDAYFIGVHGTEEGPNSQGIGQSQTINATWTAFEALADQHQKTVDYSLLHYDTPPVESLVDQALYPTRVFPAVQQGVQELTNVIKGPNGILYGILEKCPTQSIVLAGYSFGAWVVNDWLSKNPDLWPNIRAVVLYGDPLWHRSGHDASSGQDYDYAGLAAGHVTPDPYSNTPPGPGVGISDRWQSLCLQNDPICGEGYSIVDLVRQASDALACQATNCEHLKYTIYDLTRGGGEFLASQAFP